MKQIIRPELRREHQVLRIFTVRVLNAPRFRKRNALAVTSLCISALQIEANTKLYSVLQRTRDMIVQRLNISDVIRDEEHFSWRLTARTPPGQSGIGPRPAERLRACDDSWDREIRKYADPGGVSQPFSR